jgi:hypothetical protein
MSNSLDNKNQQEDLLLAMPIKYARILLGDEAKGMNDREVAILIKCLDELALLMVDMYKVQKSTQHA